MEGLGGAIPSEFGKLFVQSRSFLLRGVSLVMSSGAEVPSLRGIAGDDAAMTTRSKPSRSLRVVAIVVGRATLWVERSVIFSRHEESASMSGFVLSSSLLPKGETLQCKG